MARNSAAALARAELEAAERETRAENEDINEAIGRTDSEVFTEAMGDEPIGEDDSTELEEMGEGLEGDELDEDEQPADEQEQAGDEQELQEQQTDEQGPPPRTEPQQRQQQQRPDQPFIPPRVLRETRERFREQEGFLHQQIGTLVEQNRQLMDELRTMRSGQQPQPQRQQPAQQQQPQQQQPQRPDRWADEEGYERWQFERNQQMMREEMDRRFAAMREEQQAQQMRQLDAQLAQTARSPRGYEFQQAYDDLLGLERNQQNAALVRRLMAAPDPGAAILDWWEASSNPEYIEYHRNQIRQTYGVSPAPRQNGQRGGYQQRPYQQQQPRHEFRLPRSLSDATGASSQHMTDPEMFDTSEASVFAYGSRR